MDHTHGPAGEVIYTEPAPAAAETEAVETAAEAEVEIAKVEADRDVQMAKLDIKRAETYASEELAELRGEVRGLREIIERYAPPEPDPEPEPEPAPAPVIVEPPVEEPVVDEPPVAEKKPPTKKKTGLSWF